MIYLLIAAFGLIFTLHYLNQETDWRPAWLRASLVWGLLAITLTEGLSLLQAITPVYLGLAWLAVTATLAAVLLLRWRKTPFSTWPSARIPNRGGDRLLWAGLLTFAMLTGVVAIKAPVQTWDSLTYHMGRVAEWAHRQSVRIYPSGISRQNIMSPGAEYLTLQTYVLSQGDRFANLVNWFAYLGSIIGASWIAKELGGSRRSQIIAAVFAGTTPLAIAQASSTATDLPMAYWCLCALAIAVQIIHARARYWPDWIYLGVAFGLAFLTKPTAYSFLFPFAVWIAWTAFRHDSVQRALRHGAIVLLATLALNAGYFGRNFLTYGTPLGPEEILSYQANQVYTPSGLISNIVRNASLHAGTVGAVNVRITQAVQWLHTWLGLSPDDPRTTLTSRYIVIGPRNEDIIGNPLHLAFVSIAFVVLLLRWKKTPPLVLVYAVCVGFTYVLFSLLFKWQLFGSRLQLPFFFLSAPLVGYLAGEWLPGKRSGVLGATLLVVSLPWALSLFPRPLIPIPNLTYPNSILVSERMDLYFSNGFPLRKPYTEVVQQIKTASCTEIGFMLKGDDPEYLWWVLLGAPREALRVEWIVAGNPSAQFRSSDFEPCAIICTSCPKENSLRGLPLVYQQHGIRLHLNTEIEAGAHESGAR